MESEIDEGKFDYSNGTPLHKNPYAPGGYLSDSGLAFCWDKGWMLGLLEQHKLLQVKEND